MLRKPFAAFFLTLSLVATSLGSSVKMAQQVTLQPGWNAFYLEVAPDETPSALFADWPVSAVSAYDQAAFLETRQYSGRGTTEGASPSGYTVWRRGTDPGLSSMFGVAANTVYLAFNTNAAETAAFTTTIYGRPQAPRVSWHPSSATESQNLVGLSIAPDKAPTLGDYFDGLKAGTVSFYAYKTWGMDPQKPSLAQVASTEGLADGQVLVMTASKVSDWSGVIKVSPISGIDFGTTESRGLVELKNESTRARTVKLSLSVGNAATATALLPVPTGLLVRDSATNDWRAFSPSAPLTLEIGTNETRKVELALDRTQLAGTAGEKYGALLSVTDETASGSGFKAVIPLEATSDGGVAGESAWPKGIWLATAELDTVTSIGEPVAVTNRDDVVVRVFTNSVDGTVTAVTSVYEKVVLVSPNTDVAAGGKMKVRLPMYVSREGTMTLLQRFWYGRDADGKLHVLSGSETSDVPLYRQQRVSTAFLPTDQVRIPSGSGSFGTTATFPFVVSEHSNVNPMRHAYHPQHDGKRFDFTTPSPSGDNLANYEGTIKPELFSITNAVTFAWDETKGTAWSPEETLTGELTWTFGGLRHEGEVRASGRFMMKRLTSATLEK